MRAHCAGSGVYAFNSINVWNKELTEIIVIIWFWGEGEIKERLQALRIEQVNEMAPFALRGQSTGETGH